jgi:hypothetical protein
MLLLHEAYVTSLGTALVFYLFGNSIFSLTLALLCDAAYYKVNERMGFSWWGIIGHFLARLGFYMMTLALFYIVRSGLGNIFTIIMILRSLLFCLAVPLYFRFFAGPNWHRRRLPW